LAKNPGKCDATFRWVLTYFFIHYFIEAHQNSKTVIMGKPDSGYSGSGAYLSLSISMSFGRIPENFGVGLVQHWKEIVFVSEIVASSRNAHGTKGVSRSKTKNGQKFLVKFDTKLLKNRNRVKKHARVSENFLRLKVTIPRFGGR
jgi:hypothetical protein